PDGCGVVYELSTSGAETVLHTFTGQSDGAFPWAGLTPDGHGSLYGTAQTGADTQCFPPDGCGVVFKIAP
ncbi:MAG: choice-of-anchor tandem repeat GloVer-containing protein, partial [Terriglobales bacterium]